MFNYSSSDTVIPTLTFTKAELVYILAVLLKDIRDTDNSTRIELVEVRHYLNQIKEKVVQAISDGTIGHTLARPAEQTVNHTAPKQEEIVAPSMAELRQKFPTLSETEIKDILSKVRAEKEKEAEKKRKDEPPPPPSFIAKPNESDRFKPVERTNLPPEEAKRRENSRKFAQLLGSL